MYPQQLSAREREWIEWILPPVRAGYNAYLNVVRSMVIIGEGRRGAGEFILGHPGQEVNLSMPLAPVFAYGAIETNAGTISITLRECMDDQISMEIVSNRSDHIPTEFEELRRWTYSTWSPGDRCPQCNATVREVSMHTTTQNKEHIVMAFCQHDKRMWVYSESDAVNRLVPITNYYNELMLHKNIRDPKIALDSKRLFSELHTFSDGELTYAFLTYNKLRAKVHLEGSIAADRTERPTFVQKLRNIFTKQPS
jgi:hypothetical protein